jgi:hypothetical protein
MDITSGLSFSGSILEESKLKVNRIRPRKNIGLLTSLNFLLAKPNRNPKIIRIDAIAGAFNKANCAVIVVPILLPNIIPRLFLKDIIPVLTKTTDITVTAVEDWIIAVERAPKRVPIYLFPANLEITSLNLSDAKPCNSLLRFSIA